jgi:hypothetical protein
MITIDDSAHKQAEFLESITLVSPVSNTKSEMGKHISRCYLMLLDRTRRRHLIK